MQLHQRGVDLLVDVMDAADHVDELTQDEMWRLLKEVAEVLCLMLGPNAQTALKKELISSMRASEPRASIRQAGGTSRAHFRKVR